MIRKIVFVEVRPPDYNVFTGMLLPRLGTVLLGTILKKHGYDVKTYVESIHEINAFDILDADVIGISSITSTAPRSYELARLIRKNTNIPVFMGGPHPTFMPEEALQYCDFVLRGEADDCIVDFIRALETGTGFEKIPGLSYGKGTVIHNGPPATCKDVNDLPTPDFSLVAGLEKDYAKKMSITPIMTSRGCPYDCNFCSVTSMFGHKYRFRSKEKVIEELKTHMHNGAKWVFFYDDNFCADKNRTKELLREMIDRKLTPRWTAQVRTEIAKDPELIELMKRSGCHTVYIGLESVNPQTLVAYNKHQTVDDIKNCIRILHSHGIRVHGMFVFGADTDTMHTIRETVAFAKQNRIDSVQFLILTPLPGTRYYRELDAKNRITTKDWSLYDAHHVTFTPMGFTPHELQRGMVDATKEFYSIPEIVKRVFSLDFFNVALKYYGYSLVRRWEARNLDFLTYTEMLSRAGKAKLRMREVANDLEKMFSAYFKTTPGK